MKLHRYSADVFDVVGGTSVVKYAAGQAYPINDDTTRDVARGIAVEVDAPDDAEAALSAVAKAKRAADAAQAKADAARAEYEVAQAAAQAVQQAQAAVDQAEAAEQAPAQVAVDAPAEQPAPAADAPAA